MEAVSDKGLHCLLKTNSMAALFPAKLITHFKFRQSSDILQTFGSMRFLQVLGLTSMDIGRKQYICKHSSKKIVIVQKLNVKKMYLLSQISICSYMTNFR